MVTVLCIFPRFYIGGVSKALSFVANTCDNAGMDVHCISCSSEPETILLNKNIHRYTVDLKEKSTGFNKILNRFSFMLKLRSKIRRIKPDVIIVFLPDLTKAVVYDTIGLSIPIIGSERGNPLLHSNKLLDKYRWVFNKCAAVVFQTQAARDVYGLETINSIIPNPAISRNTQQKERRVRSGNNIITVSRLSEEKNIVGLIRAFGLASSHIPSSKLIIYGDGPQQVELEELVATLGLNERVCFAGNVKDFTEQDDNSSIFVLNTLSEGMPNALIEAMIAGYSCICTDCPIGAPKWLSDNGRRVKLVPVKDDVALSKAIIEVSNNKEIAKSLSENSKEIIELLNPERIGKQWLDLINFVVNGCDGNN